MIPDDNKTLFDFMPGRPVVGDDDPFEQPVADERDPDLAEAALEAIRAVFDPEIPVNLVDLGLIYALEADRAGRVAIDMTLTSPSCPVAGALPGDVERAVRGVAGVTAAKVRLVWTPPWHQGLMTEAAKLELGLL